MKMKLQLIQNVVDNQMMKKKKSKLLQNVTQINSGTSE
jgi:hypothetical protein